MIETYKLVRFRPLGSMLTTKFRIDDWDVQHVVTLVDLSEYRYFWFETIESIVTRSDGAFHVKKTILQKSERVFINAFVETYADVLVNNRELAERMTDMNWTHVVKGVNQHWIERFEEGDSLLEEHDGV